MSRAHSTRATGFVVALAVATLGTSVAFAEVGSIAGRVVDVDGSPLAGVIVVMQESGARQVTDTQGRYWFGRVPVGTYSIRLERGSLAQIAEGVTVTVDEPSSLTHTLDGSNRFVESIVVTAVSRRTERIVDAPGAVSVATQPEIGVRAASGQIPKLLESKPGVELTQTTLYDFNINTRGFGRTLNRRVAVLIDGRDPSIPFLGSQEWGALSLPFEDLESVELVRGPNAAVYGPNASNGTISVTTRAPRESEGGLVRLVAGELDTIHADLRYATGLGKDWYLKLLAGYRNSDGFTVSRMGAAEYAVPCGDGVSVDCLPQESVPLLVDGVDIRSAGLRLDKYHGELLFTLEGGRSDVEGVTYQSNIGRLQFLEVNRPWLRLKASHPRWNLQLTHNRRDAPNQTALGSGLNLASDSENTVVEGQVHWQWNGGVQLMLGGFYRGESVDSFDPSRGVQSLLFEPIHTNATAAYAHLDWPVTDSLRLTLAGRWDNSDTFYDDELSPRASVVYNLGDHHRLRLGYNRGFQAPNYVQSRLALDAAAPIDLGAAEAFCAPFDVACGFAPGPTRVLAVGNPGLAVEKTETFEIGYLGWFADRALLSVELFTAVNRDFFTDLLPTRGSPFGNFNTAFGPYEPPPGLPPEAASDLLATLSSALGPSFATLSNAPDGSPILAVASYTVAGRVDTRGVDVGIKYLGERWGLWANYSWFDFDVKEDLPGLEGVLALNTPDHSVRGGVTFEDERFGLAVTGRWVDGFRWITGPFVGDVDSYTTVDLSARYRPGGGVTLGVDVANVFGDEHWENWGGDLLGRRALGSVSFGW